MLAVRAEVGSREKTALTILAMSKSMLKLFGRTDRVQSRKCGRLGVAAGRPPNGVILNSWRRRSINVSRRDPSMVIRWVRAPYEYCTPCISPLLDTPLLNGGRLRLGSL